MTHLITELRGRRPSYPRPKAIRYPVQIELKAKGK
jgi:hypothetical protein